MFSDGDVFAYTLKQPVGICGLILPWNAPIAMFINKVASALAAGKIKTIKIKYTNSKTHWWRSVIRCAL